MLIKPALVLMVATMSINGLGPVEGQSIDKAIHDTMNAFIESAEVSGVVTLVGDSQGIVSLQAIGKRDLKHDLPMKNDTIFRIASMTKPMTGLAIMMLVEEGKLGLDDPVEKHIVAFKGLQLVAEKKGDKLTLKPPARLITIRDLLTHTSGLPDTAPPGSPVLDPSQGHSLAAAVDVFAKRPLSFEPGTKWAYSNVGMSTLGRLIEIASGQSYDSFLKSRIFDPLGMTDTTFYPSSEQMKRTAVTYDRKANQLVEVQSSRIAPDRTTRYPSPAGGLYSTAPDLAKLYQMFVNRGKLGNHQYLSENSFTEMTRLQTGEINTGFTENMGYGLSVGFVRKPTGVTEALSPGSFGHGGAWGTQAWIDPVKKKFVVLLIQRTGLKNSDASDMRRAFQRVANQ
jgi:CubicO group peptidase (beta-lactamase class C family)